MTCVRHLSNQYNYLRLRFDLWHRHTWFRTFVASIVARAANVAVYGSE
jgi:hypothetical protein